MAIRRYGYYLAAAAGVKVPRAVKKSITIVQLAQFALFFTHALYGTVYATHYRPRIIIVLCLFQAVVFASLFGHFFWCADNSLSGTLAVLSVQLHC